MTLDKRILLYERVSEYTGRCGELSQIGVKDLIREINKVDSELVHAWETQYN